jgi:hypothetical protein
VFWFSPGVLDHYPEELKAYYAKTGDVMDPRLTGGWRPEPIVCEKVSPGVFFAAHVTRAGRYRVIAETGGVWRVVETCELPAGEFNIGIPDAERVELLVDRRTPGPTTE